MGEQTVDKRETARQEQKNCGQKRHGNKKRYGLSCTIICCMAVAVLLLPTGCAGNHASNAGKGAAPTTVDQYGANAGTDASAEQNSNASPDSSSDQNGNVGQNGNADSDGSVQSDGGAAGGGSQTDIGLEQAKSAALAHAGLEVSAVDFIKEKLDYDDGVAEYEIEFVTAETKYEYEVRANDGTILSAEQESIERTKVNVAAKVDMKAQDVITQDEAKSAALGHAGVSEDQVHYTKVELDYDDDGTEYEIEFYVDRTEYSITIDAVSGKVLEMETELE